MLKLACIVALVAAVIVPVSTIELSAASRTVKAGLASVPAGAIPEATTSNLIEPEFTFWLSKNNLESDKPFAVTVKVRTGSTVVSFVDDGAIIANSGNTL